MTAARHAYARRRSRGSPPRSTGTGLRKGALPFTPAVEDYVKTLHRLEQQLDAPVATGALATRLEVSAPSASNMVRNLAQLGLVTRGERARGAAHPRGSRLARGR